MKNLVFGLLLASASFSFVANEEVVAPEVPATDRAEAPAQVEEPAAEAPVQA